MTKRLGLMLVLVLMLVGIVSAVQAQGNGADGITVCRDPRYGTVRLEFHNIPLDWFVWGEGPAWGYEAEGVGQYGDVLVADALTRDQDGYAAGTATIYTGDWFWSLTGDAHSVLCDVSQSPLQWEGAEIVLTPEPTPEPENQQALNCPFIQMYPKPYCYTPQANGVIPLPPVMS